jgi:hypothetical protein
LLIHNLTSFTGKLDDLQSQFCPATNETADDDDAGDLYVCGAVLLAVSHNDPEDVN